VLETNAQFLDISYKQYKTTNILFVPENVDRTDTVKLPIPSIFFLNKSIKKVKNYISMRQEQTALQKKWRYSNVKNKNSIYAPLLEKNMYGLLMLMHTMEHLIATPDESNACLCGCGSKYLNCPNIKKVS
jgi:hypothetical protein